MKTLLAVLPLLMISTLSTVTAQEFNQRVPIMNKGASTFYIDSHIEGFGNAQLLVDTGSGYVTINEETFSVLYNAGHATYIKQLRSIMADGSQKIVPLYRISSINLGGECLIRDVEVAVFPKNTRQILGLSALRKVAPFVFSMDEPANLLLSHCSNSDVPEVSLDESKKKPAQSLDVVPAIVPPVDAKESVGGDLLARTGN